MGDEKQALSDVQMPPMKKVITSIFPVAFGGYTTVVATPDDNSRMKLWSEGLRYSDPTQEDFLVLRSLKDKLEEICAICSVAMGFGTAYGNINAVVDWKNLSREEVLKHIQYIVRRID